MTNFAKVQKIFLHFLQANLLHAHQMYDTDPFLTIHPITIDQIGLGIFKAHLIV